MIKISWSLLVVFLLIFINSCNFQDREELSEAEENICTGKNDFSLIIENYEYQMTTDDFEFFSESFSVNKGEILWENDSAMTFRLFNFDDKDISLDNQIIIEADLRTHNGEFLQPGKYKYNAYDENLWARVMLKTNSGTVWFNRGPGMPEQGYVEINHISEEEVCGSFNLKVDNPDDGLIGKVKLSGEFILIAE